MSKTVLAVAMLLALLVACGDAETHPTSDSTIVDDLTARLRQENAQHYAFGCVDFDGTVLSGDYTPDAIARDARIEHAADSWAAETRGVVLGGDEDQQYVVIHDPASEATAAQEFDEREVASGDGKLTCLVPK